MTKIFRQSGFKFLPTGRSHPQFQDVHHHAGPCWEGLPEAALRLGWLTLNWLLPGLRGNSKPGQEFIVAGCFHQLSETMHPAMTMQKAEASEQVKYGLPAGESSVPGTAKLLHREGAGAGAWDRQASGGTEPLSTDQDQWMPPAWAPLGISCQMPDSARTRQGIGHKYPRRASFRGPGAPRWAPNSGKLMRGHFSGADTGH